MRPYKRYTEMTHHILQDDEYQYYLDRVRGLWYSFEYDDTNYWTPGDHYGVDYDIIRRPSGKRYTKKYPYVYKYAVSQDSLIYEELINEVDMKSFYPLQKRREMTIDEIFEEVEVVKNTIGYTHKKVLDKLR